MYWQTHARARGLLLLFHGCSHGGGDFFICDEPSCLGLPEERAILVQAQAAPYSLAVAAVSSGDRHFSRCWSPDDVDPTIEVIRALRRRMGLAAGQPLFGIGASSGGAFVGQLAAALEAGEAPVAMAAISVQIMRLPGPTAQLLSAPGSAVAVEFVSMPRDGHTEHAVAANVLALVRGRGAPGSVRKRSCEPLPLTARLLVDRTAAAAAPLGPRLAADIAGVLEAKGFLDRYPGGLQKQLVSLAITIKLRSTSYSPRG